MLWRLRSKKIKIQPLQLEAGRVDSHHRLRVVTAHYFAKLYAHCLDCDLRLRALVNQNTKTRKRHKSPLLPVA